MTQDELVSYLTTNLNQLPITDLRKQLLEEEQVFEEEFDEALKIALRARKPHPRPANKARLWAFIIVIASLAGAALYLDMTPTNNPPPRPSGAGNLAFLGHYGYVVRLPKDYMAVQGFKDRQKTVEIVHFCKIGTDPTNFLNEGLYGGMGIVRLEVQPTALAGNLGALDVLTHRINTHNQRLGEKYTLKTIQVSSLHGIQVNYGAPFPRIEAFILGQSVLYSFMAGQDDATFRSILMGLRDTHSES